MGGFLSKLGTGLEDYAKYRAMQSPLGRAIAGGMARYRRPHEDPSNQMDRSPVASSDALGGMQAPTNPDAGDPTSIMLQSPGYGDLAGVMPDLMSQGRMVTHPTIALLGERGPEAVVPMNSNPANKVSMPPRYRR